MEDAQAEAPHLSSPLSPLHNGDDPIANNDNDDTVNDTSFSSLSSLSSDIYTGLPFSADDVVRLIQCSRCSLPFRAPVRLPCGNTLCRGCLPPVCERTGISWPGTEERKMGLTCYWENDGNEDEEGLGRCVGGHCLEDCGADVLMTKLVDVFAGVLGDVAEERAGIKLTWRDSRDRNGDGSFQLQEKSAYLRRGLLGGVYDLMKQGAFDYTAVQVSYDKDAVSHEQAERERRTFENLNEAVRNELDCHVCYSLIVDPLTTPCGHTFCRNCVAMILKHTDLCPTCRRKMNMPSTVESEPLNMRIAHLTKSLFPGQVAERRETLDQDEVDLDGETTLPLFVGSLSFPNMPTFLHIYEPRYRLMIRRVMQSRTYKFGMVMYNHTRQSQEGLGRSQFMPYGTVLIVDRFEMLPDGRSLVIASGVSRFKVTKSDIVDGYHVGKTERIDDISIPEEERIECMETSTAVDLASSGVNFTESSLEAMSTQQLLNLGLDFVRKQRDERAPWLHTRVLMAYGELPTDPVQFPWWFASVLPVSDDEKYALIQATSVRERLKITCRWIRKLEAKEWSTRPSFYSLL